VLLNFLFGINKSFFLFFIFSIFVINLVFYYYLKKEKENLDFIKTETLKILNDSFKLNIDFYQSDSSINYFNSIFEIKSKSTDYKSNLKKESERLRETLSTIDSILFAIKGEEIILQNENFSSISYNAKNNKFQNTIKFNSLINEVKAVLKINENVKKEIYISENDMFYFLESHKIKSEDSILFNLRNITLSKQFEKIQKRFISDVSHELKTPLTNIKGFTIAIEDSLKENNNSKLELSSFFKIIYSNVSKIEGLIHDFLEYSKYESSKILNKTSIDVNTFLNDVLNESRYLIESKNPLITTDFSKLKSNNIIIDRERIAVILKNIIENAIIYNNKQPEIKISFADSDINDCYSVIISDNGIGISDSEKENIFNRFYRVDDARPINIAGSGLGLAIVNEIMRNYKGEIKLESELGIGTTFTLYIPK
jgi:two-component system phosphate regulon sensor histidine kinase PhoR